MLRVVLVALVVFATIYALVDCLQTDRRLVRVMPKTVWLSRCSFPCSARSSGSSPGAATPGVDPVPPRAAPAGDRPGPAAPWAPTTTPTSSASCRRTLPTPWPPCPSGSRAPAPHAARRRLPLLVGTGAAYQTGHVVWAYAVLALVVALALQVGVNFANDYSDGIRGTDEVRVGPCGSSASGSPHPGRSRPRPSPASSSPASSGSRSSACRALVMIPIGAAAIARGLVLHRRLAALRLPRSRRALRVRLLRARRDPRHDATMTPPAAAGWWGAIGGRVARLGDPRRQQPARHPDRPRARQAHARRADGRVRAPVPSTSRSSRSRSS